jgi:hypothetical protein
MLKLRQLTEEYPSGGTDRAARKKDGEEELFSIIIFQPHPSRRQWGIRWGTNKELARKSANLLLLLASR